MSPQIRINGELVADVPDETGLYQALDGSPLWVDSSGIGAQNIRQVIVLEGPIVGGQRVLGLTHEGVGISNDRRRGDHKEPILAISLREKPVRISYQDRKLIGRTPTLGGPNDSYYGWSKRTYHNPYWQKGHGGR